MTLNYSLWAAFGPGSLPLWLCLAGLILALWRPRVGLRLAGAGAFLLFVLAILPTGFWLMRMLENRYEAPDLSAMRPRAIIVLAGGENLYASTIRGAPEYKDAADRMLTGITLARRFPEAELYLVGGMALANGVTDTDMLRRTALDLGFPEARLRIVNGTLNTCENARGAAALLGREALRQSLLVTSAYHLPRAMLCFEAINMEVTPVPVDYQTWPIDSGGTGFRLDPLSNLALADLALHEWAGLIYYRLTGRTLRVWPS